MFQRIDQLTAGALPLNLAYTESGYQLAVKDQYASASKWGIPYYREHIMWLNGLPWVAKYFLIAVGFGVSAVKELGWVVTLAEMLGISATALTLILLAAVAAMGMTLYYNMGQRIRGDFMFGIGAQILPVPAFKVWVDNGNDNNNNDGQHFWPIVDITIVLPAGLYAAISLLPNSWTPLIR